MRFRQLEADHQRLPDTVRSGVCAPMGSVPGLNAPVSSHLGMSVASSPWTPVVPRQLMPMTGTATRLQATVCEQPSEAFSAFVKTSKLALPDPFSPVTPKVSLLGRAEPPTLSDSGGWPAHPATPPE